MNSHAHTAETRISGSHIRPAKARVVPAPAVITIGTRNCTLLVPSFPPPALSPSPIPLLRSG
jgi:hypothetical protein